MNPIQFEDIIKGKEEAFVIILEKDYFGSCFLMRPVVKDLKHQYKNKLRFYTINETFAPLFIKNLVIKQYPTFLFFNKKELCIKEEGCLNRWQLFKIVKQFYQNAKLLKNSTI